MQSDKIKISRKIQFLFQVSASKEQNLSDLETDILPIPSHPGDESLANWQLS